MVATHFSFVERFCMKDKTKPAAPHQWTAEDFVKDYNELCERSGFQIVFEPRWAQSKDNGDYRLVIVSSVVSLSKDR
jgi:hypothetical protein